MGDSEDDMMAACPSFHTWRNGRVVFHRITSRITLFRFSVGQMKEMGQGLDLDRGRREDV
jgi:hypothetical protein